MVYIMVFSPQTVFRLTKFMMSIIIYHTEDKLILNYLYQECQLHAVVIGLLSSTRKNVEQF